MLIQEILQTRKADAELPNEIRAALIELLFAPIASLIVGAIACSIIGAAVALRVGDRVDHGQFGRDLRGRHAAGRLRGALPAYKKARQARRHQAVGARLRIRRLGVLGLLGLLCWLTLTQTTDASLQMAVTTTTAGYAAAISGRNAGRPFIAVGQLTLSTLPMAIALLVYPDWVHKALGIVVLMFIYGMIDITLSHPRHHHPGADHDAQGSGARGALRGAGQPLRHRAQQHVARPVHARPAGPPAGLERAVPRTAASAEGAGARRHADLATRPPQHPRRQSPDQERQSRSSAIWRTACARTSSTSSRPRPTATAPSPCRAG